MDVATISGIALGRGMIFTAIKMGGSAMVFLDLPSIMILAGVAPLPPFSPHCPSRTSATPSSWPNRSPSSATWTPTRWCG
ncbi:hypothetical protein DFAR_340025 [Desulfarculales bacterium]